MLASELSSKLKHHNEEHYGASYEWSELSWDADTNKGVTLSDGSKLEVAHRKGGEGQGEEYFIVFKVGDQFFRIDGFYSSYEGVDWYDSELYEVAPQEVTVIEYRRK